MAEGRPGRAWRNRPINRRKLADPELAAVDQIKRSAPTRVNPPRNVLRKPIEEPPMQRIKEER